jgi:hypothetical protein
MEEIKLNDWVQHNRTSYKGSVIEVEGGYVRVHYYFYNGGAPLKNDFNEMNLKSEVKLLPPEPKIFSYDVLDVALLTNDQEWIKEIVSLKGENVE